MAGAIGSAVSVLSNDHELNSPPAQASGAASTSVDVSIVLCEAVREMARGNLVYADAVTQNVLAKLPDHPVALNLAGVIASRIGRRDKAVAWFGKALKTTPQSSVARANYQKACALPPPVTQIRDRYLLIKAWGAGFWSDVTHTLGCLLLAEISNRVPVTHWGSASRFGDGSDRDAFSLHFEPISPLRLGALPRFEVSDIFPRKWSAENLARDDVKKFTMRAARAGAINLLNRQEGLVVADFYIGVIDLLPWLPDSHPMQGRPVDEVYRYLIAKYLKPVREVVTAVDEFYERHLVARRTVAVHVRGSDKRGESKSLPQLNERYFESLRGSDVEEKILLLTEDTRLLSRFRQTFGARIIATECQRTSNDLALHRKKTRDGMRLGREVMIDSYLAARCSRFIGNGHSNVSAIIAVLKDWADGQCTLIAPSLLGRRNLYFFAPYKYRLLRWAALGAEPWVLRGLSLEQPTLGDPPQNWPTGTEVS
jgi:protein O-GlcNAc transferase